MKIDRADVERLVADATAFMRHRTVAAEFRQLQRQSRSPGPAGRWFFTPHAVKRYRELTGGRLSYEAALSAAIREAEDAHFSKALDTGPQLWRGPKPHRFRYLVTVLSEGSLPACITVLPPFDGWRAR